MPATSEKQKKFMDAAAHNSSFAKAAGVSQNVAKEFSDKSKGLKFGKGSSSRADLQKVNKPDTGQGKTELFKKGGDTMARKKDLGGLAALAGLAYMASRDKGGEGPAPSVPSADEGATTSPVASSAGDVEETKLDRMANVPRSRPDSRSSRREPSPPAYETPYDRSRREDRESGRDIGSMVESLKNRIATAGERGSALPLKSTKSDKNDFMGSGMKKGGAVKKMASGGGVKGWGISRGARKAKNY